MKTALLRRNPYTRIGLGLLVAGIIFFYASFFILHISWLLALGIYLLMMSSILIALRKATSEIPPEVSSFLLETGVDNMATLIEELGIKTVEVIIPVKTFNKHLELADITDIKRDIDQLKKSKS